MANKYKIKIKRADGALIQWYHTSNLLNFAEKFLDRKYPNWRFFNVFDNKKYKQTGELVQVANFTKNNRPKTKLV